MLASFFHTLEHRCHNVAVGCLALPFDGGPKYSSLMMKNPSSSHRIFRSRNLGTVVTQNGMPRSESAQGSGSEASAISFVLRSQSSMM
ncbi:hypothetical protein LCGC14_0209510 [marine sediment metagenome]|uniref:Uncharacterized protein n=1 Tax=marine sediment metagenome TaxID=412755 RepID=A0A0F9UGW2_9ZZZZ